VPESATPQSSGDNAFGLFNLSGGEPVIRFPVEAWDKPV